MDNDRDMCNIPDTYTTPGVNNSSIHVNFEFVLKELRTLATTKGPDWYGFFLLFLRFIAYPSLWSLYYIFNTFTV